MHAQHPLRRVLALIDFTFAREVVAHTYGGNGNVSVDPAVLLKLMFLLFQENAQRTRADAPPTRTPRLALVPGLWVG